jgi:hypothetical protein
MSDHTRQPDELFSGIDSGNAHLIANRTLDVWNAVERALVPVIGDTGFSFLLARCVHLCRATYPWLALDRVEPGAERFAGLGQILQGRSGADALAASRALLVTFHDALAVLIGVPLTTAMLDPILGCGPALNEEISS